MEKNEHSTLNYTHAFQHNTYMHTEKMKKKKVFLHCNNFEMELSQQMILLCIVYDKHHEMELVTVDTEQCNTQTNEIIRQSEEETKNTKKFSFLRQF